MNKADVFNMFLSGILIGLLVAWIMILTLGHDTFDSVEDIPEPERYNVTVDGVEFVCQDKPQVLSSYVKLSKCDGMPMVDVRIKEYDSVTFERGE